MTRPQAKVVARALAASGYWGIEIVEQYPEGKICVRSLNPVGSARTFETIQQAEQELAG